MADLNLTFACPMYDRVVPLATGEVRPECINLTIQTGESRQIFDKMGGGLSFDLSEMSSSEYISRFSAGTCPFVALPVFPSRLFRHGFIAVNRKAGIRSPKDLEGKRVGVPLYTITAAVWIRGLLQHEYGVDLSKIHWVQGAMEKPGPHGRPGPLPPLLKAISIEENKSGKGLSQRLYDGEIDATLGFALPKEIGRNPDIDRLFPNYREVEKDYYRRTGIFPIMHTLVIRRALYEQHPFVAQSLYDAFRKAKEIALRRMMSPAAAGVLPYMQPWLMADAEEIDEVFGGDPWPYGIEPNRRTLEALVRYLVDQSLIPAPVKIEELFLLP